MDTDQTDDRNRVRATIDLIERLEERRQIKWSAPDKDVFTHQLVDSHDLAAAVYAISGLALMTAKAIGDDESVDILQRLTDRIIAI